MGQTHDVGLAIRAFDAIVCVACEILFVWTKKAG